MQRSTSCSLGGGKDPTGRRNTEDAVSCPAEDLRPGSEVETGVNFQPARNVRGQVAGSPPSGQPGTATRRAREGAGTLSLHPEVPDVQYPSLGRIRQSMGWTEMCQTAQSRISALKGKRQVT